MRVLVIAEACNPEWVSVPLVGWSHYRALSNVADVHLVTQIRNAEAIERAGLVHGKDFTAIDSERVAARAYRLASLLRGGKGKGWTTVAAIASLTYRYFERLLWKEFGPRITAGEFDIVHRITPLSPTTGSMIARKCRKAGVPFILGPLNGGVPWPKEFGTARRKEKEWLSYLRGAFKLLPGYRSTRKNSAAILIGSRDTWKQMPERYREKCFYIPENAIDPARFSAGAPRTASTPLKVVFVGRLVPYKGADMLLEAALPLVREKLLHLTILGDGPQLEHLRARVKHEQLQDGIALTGWIEHTRVGGYLAGADVFAFPSIREFGGGAVLEAMAAGAVPVIVNYAGPAELVTPATGYLIELGNREQIIDRFRAALAAIAADPKQLAAKRAMGIRRAVEQFTWEAKAEQVMQVYHWAKTGIDKPIFAMPTPDPRD